MYFSIKNYFMYLYKDWDKLHSIGTNCLTKCFNQILEQLITYLLHISVRTVMHTIWKALFFSLLFSLEKCFMLFPMSITGCTHWAWAEYATSAFCNISDTKKWDLYILSAELCCIMTAIVTACLHMMSSENFATEWLLYSKLVLLPVSQLTVSLLVYS